MSLFNSFKKKTDATATYIDKLDKDIFPFISYEGYEDRYPTRTILERPDDFYEELRIASVALFAIFCKTLRVFQQSPDELMELMDIPRDLRPFLAIPNPLELPTFLSRFDFVLDSYGQFKVVEINADTPCALIEAYYGNGIAADFIGAQDPNEGQTEDLRRLLRQIYEKTGKKPFVFSCFHDYIEDYGTTQFLKSQAMAAAGPSPIETRFVSFYDLAVDDRGLLLPTGEYAGILYRLHPMELLINEKSPDGYHLGIQLLKLYKQGKLGLFNPPECIIMQSKGFQALVWALYEAHDFFTEEERSTIERYMLPSYFEGDKDCLCGVPYVQKPIWGREGNGVRLFDAAGNHLETKTLDTPNEVVERKSRAYLYQQFATSNTIKVETDSGMLDGYMTYSCFMTGAKASAVYGRFSPDKISGIES
jgi:glutathionylspermidine synthase